MKKIALTLALGLLLVSSSTAAFAAGSPADTANGTQFSVSDSVYDELPLNGEAFDNGLINVNKSGLNADVEDGTAVGDVIKSDDMVKDDGTTGNQRTHGEYQNNTNSCASCHQTHTAASENLLFKEGVYNTCTACHDGTLGFYNVFDKSTAGTFGGTAEGNASVHLVTGMVATGAAPGGDPSDTESFNCASCHSPHGSYSDRLLNYNPNNMARVPMAQGGNLFEGAVNAGIPAAAKGATAKIAVRATAGEIAATLPTDSDNSIKTESASTVVVALMNLVSGKDANGNTTYSYVMDETPWVNGETHGVGTWFSLNKDAVDSNGQPIKEEIKSLTWKFDQAYVLGTGIDAAVEAEIPLAYVVKLSSVTSPMELVSVFGGINITKVDPNVYTETGYGVAISKFCAACHTDYMTHSGTKSGQFTQAYRHTTNRDGYTCLRCHFAHGTDVTVMQDAKKRDLTQIQNDYIAKEGITTDAALAKAEDYLVDKNPSSALKRYTNMSVCWQCHTSSHSTDFKNTSSYYTADNPQGASIYSAD